MANAEDTPVMTYDDIVNKARELLSPCCRVCPVCNGKGCGIGFPGPGSKGPVNGAEVNYNAWQKYCINMDTLYEKAPISTAVDFFGTEFKAPIYVAPIGAIKLHYHYSSDAEYNSILVKAAAKYGIMAFTGDGPVEGVFDGGVKYIGEENGIGCPTIKPWALDKVKEKIDIVKANGCRFFAMDVDGAGLPLFAALNDGGGSKSVDQLKEIVDYAGIPFILKGVMTPKAALKAAEAGCSGIVVSNHGGRVLSCTPGTAEVLPAIADAVKGKMKILVDGGIRSGVDVFKALALGADGVLIGRPVLPMVLAGGEEGLALYMNKIIAELKDTMTMCGATTINTISRDMIWNGDKL